MKNPKRGEVWLTSWYPARGSEQKGIRPSLIIQTNRANLNEIYENTIILAISSRIRKDISFHIEVDKSNDFGLKLDSVIKCEQIITISKQRLIKKLGEVNNSVLDQVEFGLKLALGFK